MADLMIGEGIAVRPGNDYRVLVGRVFECGRGIRDLSSFGAYTGGLIVKAVKDTDGIANDIFQTITDRFARQVEPPLDDSELLVFRDAALHVLTISSELEKIDRITGGQ